MARGHDRRALGIALIAILMACEDDADTRNPRTRNAVTAAQQATPFQRAQEHFARIVGSTYGVAPASIEVRPKKPGGTSDYRGRDIGELYAMAAAFGKRRITGFASADGDVVLARRPKHFGPLVAATDDPRAIAERIAWTMGANEWLATSFADTSGEIGPVEPEPPRWEERDGQRILVFFTARDEVGELLIRVSRYELRVDGDAAVLETR